MKDKYQKSVEYGTFKKKILRLAGFAKLFNFVSDDKNNIKLIAQNLFPPPFLFSAKLNIAFVISAVCAVLRVRNCAMDCDADR